MNHAQSLVLDTQNQSPAPAFIDNEQAAPAPRWLDRRCRAAVQRWLTGLRDDRLTVTDAWGTQSYGLVNGDPRRAASLAVHDQRFYRKVLFGGSLGVGEAWRSGWWTSPDLTAVIRLFIRNREAFSAADSTFTRIWTSLSRIAHHLRHNSRRNSRKNIAEHYDLGNDFYALFLDPTMTYSSGVFERKDSTLEEASIAKYDRLCRKLNLRRDDHVLEIGGGWGGLAVHAAARYGCRVTTTTISAAQHRFLSDRVRSAGLSHKITVLQEDYRDLSGTFDKIVSIEMVEAVGHDYLDEFFRVCSLRLKPSGQMALQSITIADQLHNGYLRSVDFIQKHIFPGGCLPSVTTLVQSLTRSSDLRLFHLEELTPHYVRTLEAWRAGFFGAVDELRRLGFDDEFLRTWDYYFQYCAAAFLERQTGLVQMVLTKPRCLRDPI